MKISMRRLLRIALSVVLLVMLWTRAASQWHDRSGMWLAGSLALSVILVLVLIIELSGVQQKWRKQRDEVPKKPLGLDT